MKDKYMVLTPEGDNWVQHSNPIDTYEEAEEYCEIFFTEAAHYLITKIIKTV